MADSFSQNDLDDLFGDILSGLEEAAPENAGKKIEAKKPEDMADSENLSQDQIDALLREMLGD